MTTDASLSLTGRRAVVTGSTGGIGAATARLLVERGADVVITGRDAERGAAVVADLRATVTTGGPVGTVEFVAGDLTGSPDRLRDLADAWTDAANGTIDLLVHNAAVCPPVDTLSLTDDDLAATLAINVRAPHVLTAALVPAMLRHGSGDIVVIGSWMAHVGHAFVGLYSATKAAEEQLARSWAAEFGRRGIRVNTVSPGATRRPVDVDDSDVISQMTSRTPAGRAGLPEEVAAAVAWVVSSQASYLHGATIAVDGGITTTSV